MRINLSGKFRVIVQKSSPWRPNSSPKFRCSVRDLGWSTASWYADYNSLPCSTECTRISSAAKFDECPGQSDRGRLATGTHGCSIGLHCRPRRLNLRRPATDAQEFSNKPDCRRCQSILGPASSISNDGSYINSHCRRCSRT